MKFRRLVILIFLCYCNATYAQTKCSKRHSHVKSSASDSRSDSLDVLHTNLVLDFTDFSSMSMDASATIDFRAKVDGINEVDLDLLSLVVDSVVFSGTQLDYSHTNELLRITLSETYDTNEEFQLEIYYSGTAGADNSGWGGFYWNANYAYNLGVGFDADPHNFGRAWFPCFDNFVERCTFSFEIITQSPRVGIANGEATSLGEFNEQGIASNTWELNMEIPSYLASIAVGEYDSNASEYTSITSEQIPIWLTCPPSSVSNVNSSFVNLNSAVNTYETFYGPYAWNKVGYVFVPFNSGAMEHATNIAYPTSFADGSLNFETLMAHELGHMWWGDLITCSTAEDMWINEGMASYSEGLFLQQQYGETAYLDWLEDNHRMVLLNAHNDDGGYLPISGIDHANTYGTHVYNKGANVGHCLRSYMGDENFMNACTNFMEVYALQSVSSSDMRDFFQDYTTSDLSAFYQDWVFNPGFIDFSVDEILSDFSSGEYTNTITISQRRHEAPNHFTNLPVQLTLISEDYETLEHTVIISGAYSEVEVISSFEPKHVILNRNYELTPAILAEEKTITETGIDNFSYAEFRTDVDEMNESDSIWLRVECHFTGPHEVQPQPEFEISSDRFWRVIGNIPEDSEVSARIRYYADGLYDFDAEFFESMEDANVPEDSLILVFRPNGSTDWTEHSNYELNVQGNNSDYIGRIDFQDLSMGDYAWAYKTGEVSIPITTEPNLIIHPNPAQDYAIISCNEFESIGISVVNSEGKEVLSDLLKSEQHTLNLQTLGSGTYSIVIFNAENHILKSERLVVIKK